MTTNFKKKPETFEEVQNFISSSEYQSIKYQSNFYQRLIDTFKANNWVDIERDYFKLLKEYFSNPIFLEKKEVVYKLNSEFDFLIAKLSDYIITINNILTTIPKLKIDSSRYI